jgi:hypothetical protein
MNDTYITGFVEIFWDLSIFKKICKLGWFLPIKFLQITKIDEFYYKMKQTLD